MQLTNRPIACIILVLLFELGIAGLPHCAAVLEENRTISGRVLGLDGKPVPAEFTMIWSSHETQSLGKADAEGRFQFSAPLSRGNSHGTIIVRAPGHGMEFLWHGNPYRADSMKSQENVVVKLPKERAIRGRVVDSEGKSIRGANVIVRCVMAFDSPTGADRNLLTWAKNDFSNRPTNERYVDFTTWNPDGSQRPYSLRTTTDERGEFRILGLGDEHLVTLGLTQLGRAEREIQLFQREGFDPAPLNRAAKDARHPRETYFQFTQLFGANPTIKMDPDKILRGTVMGPDGKPVVGVKVYFKRMNTLELNHFFWKHFAFTDANGRYEIRGARQYESYTVECPTVVEKGYMMCTGTAKTTPALEPVTIDLKYAKGLVVTGTVRNKVTKQPIQGNVSIEILDKNTFVEKFPDFMNSGHGHVYCHLDDAGRFRIVTIPGPVIFMVQPHDKSSAFDFRQAFRPVRIDPKYPEYFSEERTDGLLLFKGFQRGTQIVQGASCQVLNAKSTDDEVAVHVELEPATKLSVRVVDDRNQPVTGTWATGITDFAGAQPKEFRDAVKLTVFNLDGPSTRPVAVIHEKRKLVGSAVLAGTDKDPVVKLGPGGSVSGRVVDTEGQPMVGVRVRIQYDHRQLIEAFEFLKRKAPQLTDAKGEFRVDTLFPGQLFQVEFYDDKRQIGPTAEKSPRVSVQENAEALNLGEWRLKRK